MVEHLQVGRRESRNLQMVRVTHRKCVTYLITMVDDWYRSQYTFLSYLDIVVEAGSTETGSIYAYMTMHISVVGIVHCVGSWPRFNEHTISPHDLDGVHSSSHEGNPANCDYTVHVHVLSRVMTRSSLLSYYSLTLPCTPNCSTWQVYLHAEINYCTVLEFTELLPEWYRVTRLSIVYNQQWKTIYAIDQTTYYAHIRYNTILNL